TLALHRPGHDRSGTTAALTRPPQRGHDLPQVVAIHGNRGPAERGEATLEGPEVMVEHRRTRLPEAVDIDDRDEVDEMLVAGHLSRSPHGALRRLAVTEEHEHPRVAAEPPSAQRQPDSRAQALTERPRRDVHERKPRSGMTLEIAVEGT